jgi:creatinine amidohydrolase/Fe(II)-dependent formamide hydrolase-like protein
MYAKFLAIAGLALLPLTAAEKGPLVELEKMTWPELKKAIQEEGRTTALIFNGGTEQRGPQNGAGGHNLIARKTGILIAQKLGNAIAAPVIPFSPNRANPNLPGTIGISTAVYAQLNEEVAEQLIANGFKSVVIMGDHGGGQKEIKAVAEKLDQKYADKGVRVVFCSDVYEKANNDFNKWLSDNGYPPGAHAGIPDTSEMLYLGGDEGWVRKDLVKTALGDPIVPRGTPRDPNAKRINNGISGDARRSTPELGKRFIDLKVDYAVREIQQLLAPKAASN